MTDRTCSVLDCTSPERSGGFCNRHYENRRLRGYLTPQHEQPLIARLMDVGWNETDRGCWEWQGRINDSGYGVITATRHGARHARVHRLMWEMHNGPIPEGLVVRHRCDNPPCVNPNHMELGTQLDNVQDRDDRRRVVSYANGQYGGMCKNGVHDVTVPGSLKVVSRRRKTPMTICVECDRERKRAWEQRKREAL